ncbi:MAG: thiol:disulfide interchange protein DsbD, partial [Gammaproteobacteria bacterium]
MLFRLIILLVLFSGTQNALGQSLAERLNSVIGGNTASDEILDPDVAFTFQADVSKPQSITLQWQIVEGYYLYRDKFKFAISEGDAQIDQANIIIPAGKSKEDPAFGKVNINVGEFFIDLPTQRTSSSQLPVTLELRYQGCKDDSVCYPPITKYIPLVLPSFIASAQAGTLDDVVSTASSVRLSEQDAISRKLKDGSLLLNIIAFFGFGLLLSLTPCVFPMIPILSGIIVGQGTQITTGKAFMLSLSYVLAMALTYAVLGVIAGSFYFNVQAAFQNAWVITLFSAVFVVLALSMFGFYELQLPGAIQSRLSATSAGQHGGTLKGAAFMGGISAIIVGPCVAPPLAGALLYISQTGNAVFGGLALFAMGLGFGVPLLLIGSSAGTLLPKAGSWMDAIKKSFGVIMLGVAIWFLERILPGQVSLLMWASLLIISAVYLGALDPLEAKASWQRLWKGLGLILLIYGAVLIIGAASGGKNL